MRTLLYARFSSHLQNPRSVADQLAACRARAQAEGWTILGEYHDEAISGAAGLGEAQRPGMSALLARVEAGGIDQVLTEATDRIARHQGDAFAVRELLQHAGTRLFTLHDGVVDEITGTIKGLFDARVRTDLAKRVRRGQVGTVREGRSANSVAYGHRRVHRFDEKGEPIRGLREIDPEQAGVVARCFREYDAGRSARAIAAGLNADGIPAPRGSVWTASTLIGWRTTGFGILCNPIYVGRLVYGRTKSVIDPRTRTKRFRPGDGEQIEGAAPHLRIVDDALWQRCQEQMERRAHTPPERQRRPKHVLSGLGQCGLCGESFVKTRTEYWGCRGADAGSPCTNRRLIRTSEYEARVLAELKAQMLAPDVIAAYLREYHREHARQTAALTSERARMERRHGEASRKVERLVSAIAEGAGEFRDIRDMLAAARNERDRLRRELDSLDALPVLTLHPGLGDQYRRAIEGLETALQEEATRLEAVPRLRALIDRIELRPRPNATRGLDITVHRHIDEILRIASRAVA